MNENAVKSAIQQYIAANRVDANSHDLTRLYATSTTIGACADLRADMVSQVPMRIKNKQGDVEPDHPLYRIFEGRYSYTNLMRRSELTMSFWGRNLLHKRRNVFRIPVGLDWVNPNVYSIDVRGNSLPGFRIYPSSMYHVEPISYLQQQDAVYMTAVDFDDDFDGVSEAERAFLEASVEPEKAQTMLSVFRNMAFLGGIAQPAQDSNSKVEESDKNALLAYFRRAVQGAFNAGKFLVSPKRWEWLSLQTPLEDLDMQPITQEIRLAICIAFRVPMELIVPSAASYANMEGARRTFGQSWVVPRVRWYADIFTEQLAHDFGDGWSVEPDLEAVAFLQEDAKSKVDVVNAKVGGTLLSLYDAQKELGIEPDDALKDLYLVGATPVPKAQLATLWQTQFAPQPQFPPFGGQPTPPNNPRPTTPAMPETIETKQAEIGTSLCLVLDLGGNPDLISLQNRVKTLFADESVDWSAPDDLHATVFYAPSVTDEQIAALQTALADVTVPELRLVLGSLDSFDNVGEHALHFRISRNAALLEFQATLYDLCIDLGILASSYSQPFNYKPHVTMGYGPTRHRVTVNNKISVEPTALLLSVDDGSGQRVVWRGEAAPKNMSAKSAHPRSQCFDCEAPPTKDVLWAEGMGRAWFCDKHFAEWSEAHPGEIVSVHDIADGEVPVKFSGKAVQAVLLPDAQYKELTDWQRIVEREGAVYAFKSAALPPVVSALVQLGLDDGRGVDAFAAGRSFALDLAAKSYSGTRAEFRARVADLIRAANADKTTRRSFAARLRSTTDRFGLLAFKDGIEEGAGEPVESFSQDALTTFRAWQAETSGYITNVGASLFQQGVTPDPDSRADLWANKSLDDIYFAGLRIGAPTREGTWRLGATTDHCHDTATTAGCAERNGQTKTIDEWGKVGFPRDRRLTCGGWKCDCDLYDQQGQRIGAR